MTSVLADRKFGYWVSLGTGLTTQVTFIVAVATPPLSGPWCKARCFTYPYADIAARFPRDYLWMFSALPATLLFVAFVLGLQARACATATGALTCSRSRSSRSYGSRSSQPRS